MTINSDDPPMFGTDLNNEYAVAARLLDLDERGRRRAGPERRRGVLPRPGRARRGSSAEIDAYAAANAEEADGGERHRR